MIPEVPRTLVRASDCSGRDRKAFCIHSVDAQTSGCLIRLAPTRSGQLNKQERGVEWREAEILPSGQLGEIVRACPAAAEMRVPEFLLNGA